MTDEIWAFFFSTWFADLDEPGRVRALWSDKYDEQQAFFREMITSSGSEVAVGEMLVLAADRVRQDTEVDSVRRLGIIASLLHDLDLYEDAESIYLEVIETEERVGDVLGQACDAEGRAPSCAGPQRLELLQSQHEVYGLTPRHRRMDLVTESHMAENSATSLGNTVKLTLLHVLACLNRGQCK